MFTIGHQARPFDPQRRSARRLRMAVFLGVFTLVTAAGLVYDYSRTALYRASARLAVDPPNVGDDPNARAHFALSEAQALKRSQLLETVAEQVGESAGAEGEPDVQALDRMLSAESVAQTNLIDLRAEGPDRGQLIAVLNAWIEAYIDSRKETDRHDEVESVEEARHEVRVAQASVEEKRREMEAFRRQHGIVSIEREENPSASRLKGLNNALNEAATREVNAEAKLKAVNTGIAEGKGAIRQADRNAIAALELRAADLRAKLQDLEQDYTPQYLVMDPKFKAMKANLERAEQQIERERERSERAALAEAEAEYAGAQRAVQRIRDQAEALKQQSEAFSTRFAELKRMALDLEQLQEQRRAAVDRLRKLESARKPAAVRIRVLGTPAAAERPVWPDYTRDAAITLAAALGLALIAVWITDFLRREPGAGEDSGPQPLIQIAYPVLQGAGAAGGALPVGPAPAALPGMAPALPAARAIELTPADVAALWSSAPQEGRLIIAGLFNGIAPEELIRLRWEAVDLQRGIVKVPGASAREVALMEPLQGELERLCGQADPAEEHLLIADGSGRALEEQTMDTQLACIAHDAGVRHPEEVTARALHFTYAAFLARQGMRMLDLAAVVGRFSSTLGTELMRIAPSGAARSAEQIDRVYPAFRAA